VDAVDGELVFEKAKPEKPAEPATAAA
jgi:hypothetical protein